jgi:hypothetical protein
MPQLHLSKRAFRVASKRILVDRIDVEHATPSDVATPLNRRKLPQGVTMRRNAVEHRTRLGLIAESFA